MTAAPRTPTSPHSPRWSWGPRSSNGDRRHAMNRRIFLKSGACSLVALAGPPRFLVRTAAAGAPGKVLVALFPRGAGDGLRMIVPHRDPPDAPPRPTIPRQP